MIVASCGHTLMENEGLGIQLALKDVDREGNRVVRHEAVCQFCNNRYINDTTLVLRTKTEQKMWLSGKLKV